MAIKQVQDSARLPILGKIRLGERVVSQKGSKYPKTMPHFVLKDAPDVIKVYGDKPLSLDILFPEDDPQKFMPYWYKWYAGGLKNKEGDFIGGRLQCYGDGEVAHHLALRDRVTRQVPTRPCLAQGCPDWKDGKGNQQCKQSMSIYVLLPLVSWYGVYQIDTTSWDSIHSFVGQVKLIRELNNGVVRMLPLKISRVETQTNFFDASGKEKTGVQYIMKLSPNEEFSARHGADMQKKIAHAFNTVGQFTLPEEQKLIERPMEDHYEIGHVEGNVVDTVSVAEQVAESSELTEYFKELSGLLGKKNNPKLRLITARKFEDPNTGDVDTGALTSYLAERIKVERSKTTSKTPEQSVGLI